VERTEAELAAVRERLAEEKKGFDKEKKAIEDGMSGDDGELAALKSKRADILPKVDKRLLDYYQNLARVRPGSVVVRADGGSCTGCRMMMPPQRFNDVRKGESVIMCSNCRRILYYEEGA